MSHHRVDSVEGTIQPWARSAASLICALPSTVVLRPVVLDALLHRDGDGVVISKIVEVGALLLLLGLALERGEASL